MKCSNHHFMICLFFLSSLSLLNCSKSKEDRFKEIQKLSSAPELTDIAEKNQLVKNNLAWLDSVTKKK